MSLSLDAVVSVQMLISPAAPVARGFGTALILGTATILPLYRRVTGYADITEVAADFATNTEEYKAAQIFFSQQPQPEILKIGRRFLAAQAGQLRGAGVSAIVGTYTGVTNGGFDLFINGANRQITGINASAAVVMTDVATAIQTRLAAVLGATTCVWDPVGSRFIITSPTTGTASIVLPAVAPTGGGGPTDASTLFGFTAAAGARSVPGVAIESQTDALNASAVFDPDFYFVTCTTAASTQDLKDTMAWTESVVREFFFTTSDANAYDPASTGDLLYYAKNLGYSRTFGQYSGVSPYAAVSALARASVVNFDQPNSTITLMFKQEPGVSVEESLTSAQVSAIQGKNGNVYVDRGGFAMIEKGTMANGRFQDEVHGLDWLQATLQNAVFTAIATAPTKVPQTDGGAVVLIQALNGAAQKGKTNGLLAAGIWKGSNFGELKKGDFMPNGYYFDAAPVAEMSDSDKAARKSPPITGAVIGAGAIQSCAIQVTFQR